MTRRDADPLTLDEAGGENTAYVSTAKPVRCDHCGYMPATVVDAIHHAFDAHIKPEFLNRPRRRSWWRRLWRRRG